jgi:endonuclease YncB( thermonuclease family)
LAHDFAFGVLMVRVARSWSLVLAALLATAPWAAASELVGRVVSIQDGDTLTILVSQKQMRVRLVDIDAPERKQPFGTRSRQSLSEMCAGKEARVIEQGNDRYGRTLGRVICAGVDANAEQVRRGMAWVYVRYAPADSPLYAVQAEARAARRGLWQDAKPVPPWEFRRR